MMDNLRLKAQDSMKLREESGLTKGFVERTTGIDYQRLEYVAYGQTKPTPEMEKKLGNAIVAVEKIINNQLEPVNIFTKYYTEKMTTKCLADQLEIDESILVRIMQMNEGIRAEVLGTMAREAL